MSVSEPDMPGANLAAAFAQTAGSAQLLDQTAQNILNQPDLSNPSIPSLAGDVQAAKQSASDWLQNLSPQVESVKQGIVSFAGQFNQEYATLTSLVPTVGSDPTAAARFQSTLAALNTQIGGYQGQVQNLNNALDTFREQVETNDRALGGDAQQAQSQISGLQAQMQTVGQQLSKVNHELDQERSASGLALRILEDIFSLGLAELANNQSQLENESNQLQGQLNQLQQQTNSLYQISNYLQTFGGLADQLVTGVTGLSQAWQTLSSRLNDVSGNVSAGSAFLGAELQQMQSEWNDVLTSAGQL